MHSAVFRSNAEGLHTEEECPEGLRTTAESLHY